MAVTLTSTGGLFTILGKIFHAQNTLNTARKTTVPDEVDDALGVLEDLPDSAANLAISSDLPDGLSGWQDNGTLMAALQTTATNLVVQMVSDDTDLSSEDIETALAELKEQMVGSGSDSNPDDDVDASAVGLTVTAGSGNTGTGVLLASDIGPDGRELEHALAETLTVTVSSDTAPGVLEITGEAEEGDLLSYNWPQGSSASTSLSVTQASSTLLANGGMDDEDDRDDTPDDWIVEVGTIGTTVQMTGYEVQTVIISGTPTSGTFTLKFTDVDGVEQTTAPLAFDASESDVQAALQALTGLEEVTVATTGTSPNNTHTITFTNVHPPGDQTILASSETFDTGSIAHAESTAGDDHVLRGKALEIDGNASELTQVRQRVTLETETVYCFNAWMKIDASAAAGTMVVDLIDGAGNVLADGQSTNNTLSIDLTGISTSAFEAQNVFFRTPSTLPDVVYLRMRLTTALSNTTSLYIDDVSLIEATQVYDGGPYVAAFQGPVDFTIDDTWTIAVTNNRAGEFQEMFYRNFGLVDFLLPSDSGGNETIADSLIG